MNIKRIAFLLFFLSATYFPSFAQKLNCDELVEILGIKSWRVPTPKDAKFEWDIAIVDYAPREFTSINTAKLNPQQKDLATLRVTGKDTYTYTVKTSRGIMGSSFKIDVCTEEEKKVDNLCESIYSIQFYAEAKPYADGLRFVIADISKRNIPRKQIVLRLNRMRPNGTFGYP